MGPSAKPIFFLLAAAVVLFAVFRAVARPPEERYDEILRRTASDPSAAPRDAMHSRWQLGEQHLRAGDLDAAEKEYRSIIDDYPYTEIEYGFRTDDARQRLREIQALRRGERAATPFPEY